MLLAVAPRAFGRGPALAVGHAGAPDCSEPTQWATASEEICPIDRVPGRRRWLKCGVAAGRRAGDGCPKATAAADEEVVLRDGERADAASGARPLDPQVVAGVLRVAVRSTAATVTFRWDRAWRGRLQRSSSRSFAA